MEEENGSGDELDLDQVEEEMAAQYGSDEEDYDDNIFNINVVRGHVSGNLHLIRAQVLESDADADAWKIEVERAIPRLKLALKPGILPSKQFFSLIFLFFIRKLMG